jgi:predicted PurR-regulated permease PerM
MLISIIVISIILLIVITYLISVIININKIVTQIIHHNNYIIKYNQFQTDQYNINKEIISKIKELENNDNIISYIDYLKFIGKTGQA